MRVSCLVIFLCAFSLACAVWLVQGVRGGGGGRRVSTAGAASSPSHEFNDDMRITDDCVGDGWLDGD